MKLGFNHQRYLDLSHENMRKRAKYSSRNNAIQYKYRMKIYQVCGTDQLLIIKMNANYSKLFLLYYLEQRKINTNHNLFH